MDEGLEAVTDIEDFAHGGSPNESTDPDQVGYGTLGKTETDPMPIFSIKAQDLLALVAIYAYERACHREGLVDQAKQVALAYEEIEEWQARNPDKLKFPDHKHVPVESRRNPHCSNCGDLRGGPMGHETSECRLNR